MSKKKIAINGFGRIGRLVFRAYLERAKEFNETSETRDERIQEKRNNNNVKPYKIDSKDKSIKVYNEDILKFNFGIIKNQKFSVFGNPSFFQRAVIFLTKSL